MGSTSSGAIDKLDEIAEVGKYVSLPYSMPHYSLCAAAKENPDLFIHVDAAWAGVALACPEFREMSYLKSINACAHSFCTNFHKVSTNIPHIFRSHATPYFS